MSARLSIEEAVAEYRRWLEMRIPLRMETNTNGDEIKIQVTLLDPSKVEVK